MTLTILAPHAKDLGGGFTVRRLLPAMARAAVGPFVFFDHMGPVTAQPADNHDVRPHPHIGLATVTALYEGAMMHRDSTGAVQRIEPGAVNLMVSGAGVVHSERTPDDLRGQVRRSQGLQLWVALPAADEECVPAFHHVGADAIPERTLDGVTVRVLMGALFGERSPVPEVTPAVYAEIRLPPGGALALPPEAPERALYAVDAPIEIDGQAVAAQHLAVLEPGRTHRLVAPMGARVALVGGQSVGHRFLWWNFVSSRKARLVQAADDWAAGRFAAVPGETEFIPLPERRPVG